jgi:predicted nucleic acid-binding Zn ribbon protein
MCSRRCQHLSTRRGRDAAMAVLMLQTLMLVFFIGTCVGVVYYLLQLLK